MTLKEKVKERSRFVLGLENAQGFLDAVALCTARFAYTAKVQRKYSHTFAELIL